MEEKTWYINIDCRYLSTKEYIRFMKTPEYRVLMFLVSKIVRRKSDPNNRNYYQDQIYNDWYKNGMLCTRYDQNTIAEAHEWITKTGPNRRYVGRVTRKLEKDKMLKTYEVPTKRGNSAHIYQLGYINDEGQEKLFYDIHFSLIVELNKESKKLEKKIEYEAAIKEYENTMNEHFKQQIALLHGRNL